MWSLISSSSPWDRPQLGSGAPTPQGHAACTDQVICVPLHADGTRCELAAFRCHEDQHSCAWLAFRLGTGAGGYRRAMVTRISLSVSVMRSPERSTVTVWRVPVNRNGAVQSVVMAEPGLAAGEPAGVESDGGGDRELVLGDELAIEIQLGAAGGAFAAGDVGGGGGLEPKPQLVPPGGQRVR